MCCIPSTSGMQNFDFRHSDAAQSTTNDTLHIIFNFAFLISAIVVECISVESFINLVAESPDEHSF